MLGVIISVAFVAGCGHRSSSSESAAPAGAAAATAPSAHAAAIGTPAPDAQLTGTSGEKVALADQLHRHARTVVVFYRGFW
jgi:hypothetical protein